ncbi:MAG: hypothetical protein IPG90_02845 [Bacteroidetes bacterium]|nr:hypothetical protein [Bacteroidota bacterium]
MNSLYMNTRRKLFKPEILFRSLLYTKVSVEKGLTQHQQLQALRRPALRRLLLLLLVIQGLFMVFDGKVNAQTIRCVLHCRDTSICFNIPDSMVQLSPPAYTFPGGPNGGAGGPDCQYDSIWNNAP